MADQVTGKDIYYAVMTLTSAVATIVSAIGTWIPEPERGKLVAIGVISSVVHAALLDPKVVALLGDKK